MQNKQNHNKMFESHQLTVCRARRLLLNVTREASSSQHVVQGWLKKGSTAVSDRTVRLKVNETEYLLTTDGAGHFGKSFDFQIKDNKPTLYMILASFDGDNAKNATAWATTIDGNSYPACTTTYFGYKPSANNTSIVVEPQATIGVLPRKAPEQMEQEAKTSGAISPPEHEFSIWPPFYKLHLGIDIGSQIHVVADLLSNSWAEWLSLEGLMSGIASEAVAAGMSMGLVAYAAHVASSYNVPTLAIVSLAYFAAGAAAIITGLALCASGVWSSGFTHDYLRGLVFGWIAILLGLITGRVLIEFLAAVASGLPDWQGIAFAIIAWLAEFVVGKKLGLGALPIWATGIFALFTFLLIVWAHSQSQAFE